MARGRAQEREGRAGREVEAGKANAEVRLDLPHYLLFFCLVLLLWSGALGRGQEGDLILPSCSGWSHPRIMMAYTLGDDKENQETE